MSNKNICRKGGDKTPPFSLSFNNIRFIGLRTFEVDIISSIDKYDMGELFKISHLWRSIEIVGQKRYYGRM